MTTPVIGFIGFGEAAFWIARGLRDQGVRDTVAALHGERRAHEMAEVSRTLSDAGVDPIMASATARRLKWCADLGLKARFGDREPKDYHDVLNAIAAAGAR